MTNDIYVRWKHLNPDGTPIKNVEGLLLSVQLDSTNKYRFLIQTRDGFETVEACDVVTCDPPGLQVTYTPPPAGPIVPPGPVTCDTSDIPTATSEGSGGTFTSAQSATPPDAPSPKPRGRRSLLAKPGADK